MNGSDLYQTMKDALVFFGLRWSQMDRMSVSVGEGTIFFECNGKTVSFVAPRKVGE